jgi:hypothetical protein
MVVVCTKVLEDGRHELPEMMIQLHVEATTGLLLT